MGACHVGAVIDRHTALLFTMYRVPVRADEYITPSCQLSTIMLVLCCAVPCCFTQISLAALRASTWHVCSWGLLSWAWWSRSCPAAGWTPAWKCYRSGYGMEAAQSACRDVAGRVLMLHHLHNCNLRSCGAAFSCMPVYAPGCLLAAFFSCIHCPVGVST